MVIVSRQNPLVKELASLKEKKGRREHGTFLVEGVHGADRIGKASGRLGGVVVLLQTAEDQEPVAVLFLQTDDFRLVGRDVAVGDTAGAVEGGRAVAGKAQHVEALFDRRQHHFLRRIPAVAEAGVRMQIDLSHLFISSKSD